MTGPQAASRSAAARNSWRARRHTAVNAIDRPVPPTPLCLEHALCTLATAAAYGMPMVPMFWRYRAVRLTLTGGPRVSRWPDGTRGRTYVPAMLELDGATDEPCGNEDEFNRLDAESRAALGEAVPLLVRLQYLNECHALNGAAAIALIRYAARHAGHWHFRGRPVASLGWRWGDAPDGLGLTIVLVGTDRAKRQAHAHQTVSIDVGGGDSSYVYDLSAAQFGDCATLNSAGGPAVLGPIAAVSSTLRERARRGIAPALLTPHDPTRRRFRLAAGQRTIERAAASTRGLPSALCAHVMPARLYGAPESDDAAAMVGAGVADAVAVMERALERVPSDAAAARL